MDHSITNTFVALAMKSGLKVTLKVWSPVFIFLIYSLHAECADLPSAQTKNKLTPATTKKALVPPEVKYSFKKSEISSIKQTLKTGLFFWGQSIKLLTSDSRTENVDVKYTGLSLGYEYIQKWTDYSLWFEVMGSLAQGQAASAGTSIIYRKPIAPSALLLTDAGFAYHPHDNVLVGAGLGVFMHQLALDVPTSALISYEFKYSQPLKIFFAFKLGWLFADNWHFEQKMVSAIEPGINVGWNLSVGYGF